MKRARILVWLLIFLFVQGCIGQPAAQANPAPALLTDAPISGVDVLAMGGNPPDVRLVVHGSLPDGCARLGQEEISQDSRLITVRLPASRVALAKGQACPPGPVNYDKVIRLQLGQAQPGGYAVLVNGMVHSFQIHAAQPVQPQAQQPSAVQPAQPAPAPTAAPVPLPNTGNPQPIPPADLQASTENQPAVFKIVPPEQKSAKVSLGLPLDSNCNKVGFYGDLSVPNGTAFDAGETFVKIWRVRNEGTCAWDSSYQLVFAGGYKFGAADKLPLPEAKPGAVVQISVPMTAPLGPGAFESDWAITGPDGKPFGTGSTGATPLSVTIGVREKPPDVFLEYNCGTLRNADFEQQILTMINARRAEFGLPPHKLLDSVSAVARAHSVDMACRNLDTHKSSNGLLYTGRLQQAGIPFENSNEIIFAGNGGPASAVFWWMEKSPLHRSIILSSKYMYVGVGVVIRKDVKMQDWYTVDFIRPPGE